MVMDPVIEMTSQQNNIDPYYDCNLGAGPLPTVVKNFKIPNSGLKKDGPFLQIVEQPQTKFRFRYKSEMVGTHGQLKAESSDKNKTIFPTVKLCNWTGGPALVRLMLYTAEENEKERKRHVHELSGKNCNKEGFTGGCEVVVDEKNQYTAIFPNLGIIHIAKRDVPNIIFQRKKEELVNYACMAYPNLRNEGIQHNIPPTDIKKLKEESEEEAKVMDLNKVVLHFQAYSFNTEANCYRPITEHVYSDVIFNLKNASTGELKIVRISAVSAPCTGGTEVWMLVEKVKKNNVRIKFYEVDKEGVEIWKSYGEFKETDVHHQYAIVFRTPAYHSSSIHDPVSVKIQLERPTDNDTSEPLDFTYTPENLKRSNPYAETMVEYDIKPQKRARPSPSDPIDLKTGPFFLGSDINPYASETLYKQPSPQMVPSPITPADSPSSIGFYSPHHPGMNANSPQRDLDNGNQQVSDLDHYSNSNNYHMTLLNGDATSMNNFLGTPPYSEEEGYSNSSQLSVPSSLPSYQQVPSPVQLQPSPYNTGIFSPNPQPSPYDTGILSPNSVPTTTQGYESVIPTGTMITVQYPNAPVAMMQTPKETPQQQIQQFNDYHKQVINSKTEMNNLDFSDLIGSPTNQNENMDLLNFITNNSLFSTCNGNGDDIQADFVSSKDKSQKKGSTAEKRNPPANITNDVDVLSNSLAGMSVSNPKSSQGDHQKHEPMLVRDIAFRVAMKAAECLQVYAACGDTSLLLAAHRYLLGVQNNQGDNSLHTAITNKNLDTFTKILKAAVEVSASDLLLNAQNLAGETPLHAVMKSQHPIMIQQLLSSPGCKSNILDLDGNSCLHVAAEHANHLCLSLLLTQQALGTPGAIDEMMNKHNFHGKTPLHLAVSSGCLNKVKLLLQAGADVHICERKRGSNSLHLAVMSQNTPIAKYLINHTDITVDARMFDGNTALHISAQAGNRDICSLLMKAKANPSARNNIKKHRKIPDSEDEEEDSEGRHKSEEEEEEESDSVEEAEEEFYTPFDYAEESEEILSILRGNFSLNSSEDSSPSISKPCCNHEDSKNQNSSSNLDSGIDISSTSESFTAC